MAQSLKAIYRNGAFIPQTPCDLPDGAEVELTVRTAEIEQPAEPDPEERKRILARMVERMKANPLAPDAPRLTREELHERR
jgi:predicted DNA-binding antitoxin AbrB/MazE fold protein